MEAVGGRDEEVEEDSAILKRRRRTWSQDRPVGRPLKCFHFRCFCGTKEVQTHIQNAQC